MTKKELSKYEGKLVVLYPKDKSKEFLLGCLVKIEDELKLLQDSTTIPLNIDPSTIERVEIAPKEEEHEVYSIDNNMKKNFLQAVNNHGAIRTMDFFVGYPPKWVSIKTEDMCQAILKDVEELEEKKNENGMPVEAYENQIKASNETISRLLKENKDHEYAIDKLQRVIVAQAIQLMEVQTENKQMKEYTRKLVEDTKDPK